MSMNETQPDWWLLNEADFLYNADPDCKHVIVSGYSSSGIRCSECGGWFCY